MLLFQKVEKAIQNVECRPFGVFDTTKQIKMPDCFVKGKFLSPYVNTKASSSKALIVDQTSALKVFQAEPV